MDNQRTRGGAIRLALAFCVLVILGGCWQAAAARAAKQRTTETGYVAGTAERELGVQDPLGRKQRAVQDLDDDDDDEEDDDEGWRQ